MADLADNIDAPRYEVEMVPPSQLSPHPDNYRGHPEAQITQIRQSLRDFGIYKNIVVARDYTILAGHGVVRAAELEGYAEVPVYRLDVAPDAALAHKLIAADNELPRLSDDDDKALAALLKSVMDADDLGLPGTGFEDEDYAALLDNVGEPPDLDGDDGPDDRYTEKIETPTYEPSGETPPVEDLFDAEKTNELLAAINDADLPDDIEQFLRLAAYRHTRFNFERIADFYADTTPEVQALMEASALVIIDFDDAVEEGFVQLSRQVRELLSNHPQFDDS